MKQIRPKSAEESAEGTPTEPIMSRAARRKLKKPVTIVTTEMKEKAREDLRELRKHLRMVKANGSRRKVAKEREKRTRERDEVAETTNAFDEDYRPLKKGRRIERAEDCINLPANPMLPRYVQTATAESLPSSSPSISVKPLASVAAANVAEETVTARPGTTTGTTSTTTRQRPAKRRQEDELW